MIILEDAGTAAEFVEYAESFLKESQGSRGGGGRSRTDGKGKRKQAPLEGHRKCKCVCHGPDCNRLWCRSFDSGDALCGCTPEICSVLGGYRRLDPQCHSTATAREVANVTADPFGTGFRPAPIEDAPLIAKQMAVKKVCMNALLKLGIVSDTAALKGVTTIALDLWDIFPSTSGNAVVIKLTPNGRFLLAAGGGTVEQWDIKKKEMIRTYKIKGGKATALTVASDNRTLAVGDHKGFVHIFNMTVREAAVSVRCHRKSITALAFGPDGAALISSAQDKTIQTMNPILGKKLTTFKGHRKAVNSIAVTPDGRYAMSAGNDLSIKMWDLNVGKERKSIQESTDKLLSMALSRDGSMVAVSTVDVHIDLRRKTRQDVRHIIIRNTVTGEEIRTLTGHEKDVTTLVFHPDRRFLASGSIDNTIRIWDLQKGDVVRLSTRMTMLPAWISATTVSGLRRYQKTRR